MRRADNGPSNGNSGRGAARGRSNNPRGERRLLSRASSAQFRQPRPPRHVWKVSNCLALLAPHTLFLSPLHLGHRRSVPLTPPPLYSHCSRSLSPSSQSALKQTNKQTKLSVPATRHDLRTTCSCHQRTPQLASAGPTPLCWHPPRSERIPRVLAPSQALRRQPKDPLSSPSA